MSSDFSILSDNDDLPMGWAYCTVGDTGEYINGCAFKPTDWGEIGKPIIRIQNLTDLDKSFNRTTRQVEEKYNVCDGDILVSWSATLDCFIWSRGEALLNQHIFKVVPNHLVVKTFLFHLLRNAIQEMKQSEHLHGSTMKHINREPFMSHKIALPPLNEQRRIVEKVEALMARSRRAKEALDAIPKLIEQFRQSVLAAAFRGDLTADWREQNPNIEPASKLLERIHGDVFKGAQQKLRKEITLDVLSHKELPDTWKLAKVRDICKESFYGPRFSKDEYDPEGVLSIRTTDMTKNGRIIVTEDTPKVRIPLNRINDYKVEKEDLLITRSGSIGMMAVFKDDYLAIPSAYLIRFRFSQFILTDYIFNYLKSPTGQKLLGLSSTAVTQSNINAEAIKELPIPICSYEEQIEILRRIENQFSIINRFEETYKAISANFQSLDQSILSKAFRGELVEQDPNDEPASVLLERIQQEREKEKTKFKQTSAKKLKK